MKKWNVAIAVLLAGILVCAASFLCEAADMTKGELASILVNKLGIEMPANADTLSDAELYDIQAKSLAERGITLFANAQSDWKVFSCDLANVLYDALVGPNTASIKEKFDYLANLGYMTPSPGYKCEPMSSEDIIAILNIPELSAAIAEAYSPPPGIFGGAEASEIPPAPANPEPEGIASSIK